MLAIANYTAGASTCFSANRKLAFVYSSTANNPATARLHRLNTSLLHLRRRGGGCWGNHNTIRKAPSSASVSSLHLLQHNSLCLVEVQPGTTTVGLKVTRDHSPPKSRNLETHLLNLSANAMPNTKVRLPRGAVKPLFDRHGRASIVQKLVAPRSMMPPPPPSSIAVTGMSTSRDGPPILMSSTTKTRAYAQDADTHTTSSNNWVRHKPNSSSFSSSSSLTCNINNSINNDNKHSWKVKQWNEDEMVYRKTVYDHRDWKRHRSNTRHSRHMAAIASSRVAAGLLPPVLKLTVMASVLVIYNMWALSVASQYLLRIPSLPFQLAAPAVALLLVFRTNASYGRFDEARKAWASIVNRTRDMARQSVIFFQDPADGVKLQHLLRFIVSFPYCLKDHLTHEDDLRKELSEIMFKDGDDGDDVDAVMCSPHRPNYVLQVITQFIHNSHLTDMQKALLDANVTSLHDSVGVCERIFSTPIPVSYTRLTSRILVIWHLLLPLVLWEQCTWVTIPATFLSATIFFCIEEVGVLIEEPFSILPLGNISNIIRQSVDNVRRQQQEFSEKARFWKT